MLNNHIANRIGHLKLCGQYSDSPALRLHISKILTSLDVRPPGMSPSEIFIVYQIKDPVPGTLSVDAAQSINAISRWHSALSTQLSELYQRAGRPAKNRNVGEVGAVLFMDQAELLACFCRDIADVRVTDRWWWRSHFGKSLPIHALPEMAARLFLQTPQLLPAVVHQLAQWRCDVSLIKSFEAPLARQLMQAVLHEFGLAELDRQLLYVGYATTESGVVRPSNVEQVEHQAFDETVKDVHNKSAIDQVENKRSETVSQSVPAIKVAPPWLMGFDQDISTPGLNKEQIVLLGISRLLHSAPLKLRQEYFQKQVIDWWVDTDSVESHTSEDVLTSTLENQEWLADKRRQQSGKNSGTATNKPGMIAFSHDVEKKHRALKQSASRDSVESNSTTHQFSLADSVHEPPISEKSVQDLLDLTETQSPKFATDLKPNIDQDSLSAPISSASMLSEQQDKTDKSADYDLYDDSCQPMQQNEYKDNTLSEDEWAVVNGLDGVELFYSEAHLDTQFGGLLYLINLLQQLHLPEVLSQQWRLEQQISRWALLDALARSLLGKKYQAHKQDPLWRLLARLDQRRCNTPIGKGFCRYNDYRIPLQWFGFFNVNTETVFNWALHRRRLRIWTDFAIIVECDIDESVAVEQQVFSELQQYLPTISIEQLSIGHFAQAPQENRRQLINAGMAQDLAHLLALIVPPIRRYLQQALKLDSLSPQLLLNKLFRCDGRVFSSSSHIDLVAGINSTSFDIRCSGLDQDPGWLPEYGRVVLFHFK